MLRPSDKMRPSLQDQQERANGALTVEQVCMMMLTFRASGGEEVTDTTAMCICVLASMGR